MYLYCGTNNNAGYLHLLSSRRLFCCVCCVLLLTLPAAVALSMSFLSKAAAAAAASSTASSTAAATTAAAAASSVVRIPQTIWRQAALDHQDKIKELLLPALVSEEEYEILQTQIPRRFQKNNTTQNQDNGGWVRPLDPNNPVCNFLIEYYGLKGHKGTKRLARWSPSPNLLLRSSSSQRYDTLEELQAASRGLTAGSNADFESLASNDDNKNNNSKENESSGSSTSAIRANAVGVFLEDVTEDDMATLLHLRGAILESNGALYSPSLWFDRKKEVSREAAATATTTTTTTATATKVAKHPASPFLWFRSILQQTLRAEPIMHCHGLHEWAMQYQPEGEPPPPSAKYQSHLNLRVSQEVINQAVERKGISCTHVDALRFFAPAAGPLNHHGASLQRTDQLKLEQPACVHAQMDLLKIALRLQPFCDAGLMQRILKLSMDARRLDVAASPYDATAYGVGIVPVETKEGRALYRQEQRALMERAEPIRKDLLNAYDVLLKLAFDEDPVVLESQVTPSAERYATAQPGGKPWRKNLMESSSS